MNSRSRIYVALLFSIRIGDGRRLLMADWRTMMEEIGLNQPRTLIATGNAVFATHETSARWWNLIEEALHGKKLSLVLDTLGGSPVSSWASRSRGAARLSSTPWTVRKSQPSRPSTSSSLVLAFTDSGSAIGCADRCSRVERMPTDFRDPA